MFSKLKELLTLFNQIAIFKEGKDQWHISIVINPAENHELDGFTYELKLWCNIFGFPAFDKSEKRALNTIINNAQRVGYLNEHDYIKAYEIVNRII
ncbi:MAG: hypothetical protein PSX81_02655 [bacterium]|nr:hypothetical protein [bacterium]